MPAEAAVTLIGVALLVAVLAGYLIHVILILRHVVLTLDVVLRAVVAVSDEAAPIGEVTNAINTDLEAGRRALEDAVAQRSSQEESASPASGLASPGVN